MKRIALLLPSRGRPESIERLLRSVEKTVGSPHQVNVHIRVDDDDEAMRGRMEDIRRSSAIKTVFVVGPRKPIGTMWNDLWKQADADIYMLCADDMVFESKGWDEKVREHFKDDPFKLVFGRDDLVNSQQANHWFVSREGCDLLGYFCPEGFEVWYPDTWVYRIYFSAARNVYDPTIHIPHLQQATKASTENDRNLWQDGVRQRQVDATKLKAKIIEDHRIG